MICHILETLQDGRQVTITDTQEVAYWLLIGNEICDLE